jgi:teichuronic acid biosynthesis glycosyltransferase TuaG
MPKVSIIIPTYNAEKFLNRTIESVTNQTYKDWELIIVDDGSKDKTPEIIKDWERKDQRIEGVLLDKNSGGPAHPRNIGIQNSHGEYIAFLDHDDEWLPEKLERQINFLESHQEYAFCYTADKIVYSDGQEKIKRYSNNIDLSSAELAGIGISVPSSYIYRKKVFDLVGPFDENRDLSGLDDNDWSVRGHFLKGYYLDEPLTIYHIYEGQLTKKNAKDLKKQIRGLKYILRKNWKVIAKNKRALLFRIAQIFHQEIKYVLRYSRK